MLPPPPEPPSRFADISTHLSAISAPQALLERYGQAITGYLAALLGPDDGADATNAFAVRVLEGCFTDWTPGAGMGPFRNYLQTSVRNHANTFRRRHLKPHMPLVEANLSDDRQGCLGDVWLREWRDAVLSEALKELKRYQESRPEGNVFYTLIRLFIDEAGAQGLSARDLAARLSKQTGRPYSEENARQQTLRARRKFAELLLIEASRTLDEVTPAALEQELRTLGLFDHVSNYLPSGQDALRRLLTGR